MSEQQEYQEGEDFQEGGDFQESFEESVDESAEDDGSINGLSIEEQAKIAGWNPDHPAGKSAEEFLARNQEHLGLARAENEKLYGEIAELKNAMMLTTKFLESREEKARQAGYERAIREQEARMEQAVEDADRGAFEDARKKAEAYRKAKDEDKVDPIIPQKDAAAQMQEAVQAHFSKAPKEMFDLEAKREVWLKEVMAQGRSGKNFEDAKKEADRAVIQMFNLKRNMPGINGGSEKAGKISKLSDIPGATEAYNQLVKKIPDLTVEEYLEGIK